MEQNMFPTCCLPITTAQLRRGQVSIQSTLDVQEGSGARTGEGWTGARDGLWEAPFSKGSRRWDVTIEKWLGTLDRVVTGQSREPFQCQQVELPPKEMAKHTINPGRLAGSPWGDDGSFRKPHPDEPTLPAGLGGWSDRKAWWLLQLISALYPGLSSRSTGHWKFLEPSTKILIS